MCTFLGTTQLEGKFGSICRPIHIQGQAPQKLDAEEQEGLRIAQIEVIPPLEPEIEMQEAEPMMPTPRRMTFHFEDDTA